MIAELSLLYAPNDIAEAHRRFGATCGPCAFAAFFERDVTSVMSFFPQFPEQTFTNLPAMKRALRMVGACWERRATLPHRGLVLMCGPQRYYSRHWLAVQNGFVYEASLEMWLPVFLWTRDFLPLMAADFPGPAEDWRVEAGFEVTGYTKDILAQATRPKACAEVLRPPAARRDGWNTPPHSRRGARQGGAPEACDFQPI